MSRHPFLTFGLPFIAIIVAGSFVLTPATAIRYEKHDRKVRQLTKEEELNVRRAARKVDMKEEYYVSSFYLYMQGDVGYAGAAEKGMIQGLEANAGGCRDLLGGIWTIGSRSGLRGCLERATAYCKS